MYQYMQQTATWTLAAIGRGGDYLVVPPRPLLHTMFHIGNRQFDQVRGRFFHSFTIVIVDKISYAVSYFLHPNLVPSWKLVSRLVHSTSFTIRAY